MQFIEAGIVHSLRLLVLLPLGEGPFGVREHSTVYGRGDGGGLDHPGVAERRSGARQMMIAIDIAQPQPLAAFSDRMERYVAELQAVPLPPGFAEVFYPGAIEARSVRRTPAAGLVLPRAPLAAPPNPRAAVRPPQGPAS